MKKFNKMMRIVFCLLMVYALAGNVQTVKAAAKSGLKLENGQYYYYSKGKKITNTFKKVAVSTDSDGNKVYKTMYFGKTGAAYRASSKTRIVVKTIDGKKYGFNIKGYLLSKDLYMRKDTGKFYYFTDGGVYSSTVSAKFNNLAQYGASYSKLSSLLKKYNIKVKKTTTSATCNPSEKYAYGTDVEYTFTHFIIYTCKDKNGKNQIFIAADYK